ncbi:30S ribosomal protein S1 [uncultured Desulfatiglans sp.]|nr:30S ribosomal protein S1 [uncultured Desulfatiglans sp.]
MTIEFDESIEGVEEAEESFADLLAAYDTGMNEDLQVGDRIEGKIIAIGDDTVFVDTGTKIDGVVERAELLDEEGNLPCKVGDTLTLYAVSVSANEIRLSRALSGVGGFEILREAFENRLPVLGKVRGTCKGGFNVEVMNRRGFCPISQIDIRYVEQPEQYVGESYEFLITRLEERNIVVSRRDLLNRELEKTRAEFMETLSVGSIIEGEVVKLMPYGAFVRIAPGVEGMAHISELGWSRVERPEEVLRAGERVKVKVIGVQKADNPRQAKISLSIKQLSSDPWDTVQETVQEGQHLTGRVVRCAPFGVFVEIAPGIEGLVHISEMSYTRRVAKPEDLVAPGDPVSVVVKRVDPENRRISLSMKDAEGDPWALVGQKYPVGKSVTGTIEKRGPFGFFINLEPGITGLMPKSKMKAAADEAALDRLKEGDPIEATVSEINPAERKITLLPPAKTVQEEDSWQSFSQSGKGPLGSLGAELEKVLRPKNRA